MGVEQLKAILNNFCGDDLTTVNAARVSFDKHSEWEVDGWEELLDEDSRSFSMYPIEKLSDKDTKLIHYLAKHGHYSPFGHSFASFTIEAPVFVARQLVKHKFLRMNEVSRRYVDNEPEFYQPDEWRIRTEDKKQGSKSGQLNSIYEQDDIYGIEDEVNFVCLRAYKEMLKAGIAPEQARIVLPQSMMTQWWWSGSLDAFASMCKLRCKEDTQYETRMIANQISEQMSHLYPVSWSALMETN